MQQTYEELVEEIKHEFITFKIIRKRDNFLMQAINVLLHVFTFGYMDEFLTRFVTTIGNTIYVPDYWYDQENYTDADKCLVLRHERIHMRQRRKYEPLWYTLLYVLLPFPMFFAYFRMKFEKEAYEETFRARLDYFPETHYLNENFYKQKVIRYFTSAEYCWMWPFKKSIESWYDEAVKRVLTKQ